MANSSSVYDWFQERLEIQEITDDLTSKYVPPHVNIFYCLGGITLVCFLIQFATGFAMTFYYKPCLLYTSDAADESCSVDLGGRRIIKKCINMNTASDHGNTKV